jgi:hypothetical protein
MARNEAYRKAEQKIEEARRSGVTELDLSGMELTELPESLGQLTQLQSLNIQRNGLRELPESLGRLKGLQTLDLFGNNLQDVPSVVRSLRLLRKLVLSGNKLSTIPEWIGELTSLEYLSFAGNNLTSLPQSLESLVRLAELRVGSMDGGNSITDIPASLATLETLKRLLLDKNPLNPELAAAYKEGLNAVKRYLRSKAEAQIVLNEAKLILIGEGEVGKSCLLGALRGDPWEDGRPTTHGIEIKPVKVTDPNTGTEITLNGWDFGGQRVYRPTHQLFFSAPAVYLVVWKPREGPQQGFVKEWIKLVKHREPDAKILVVATHGGPGARQPDIDRQEIWDLFGKDRVIDFFHVDSKPPRYDKKKSKWTGKCNGIEELKNAITKLAASLPEVGRSVPKRWQDVREELKETGKAYLPLEEALGVCRTHKMEDEEALDFLRISVVVTT